MSESQVSFKAPFYRDERRAMISWNEEAKVQANTNSVLEATRFWAANMNNFRFIWYSLWLLDLVINLSHQLISCIHLESHTAGSGLMQKIIS